MVARTFKRSPAVTMPHWLEPQLADVDALTAEAKRVAANCMGPGDGPADRAHYLAGALQGQLRRTAAALAWCQAQLRDRMGFGPPPARHCPITGELLDQPLTAEERAEIDLAFGYEVPPVVMALPAETGESNGYHGRG